MSSPEERWWSVRAGEYVLGTLRGPDLALFERILAHDSDVQAQVLRWERRLAALNATAPAREPAAHVWPEVLARIRAEGPTDEAARETPGEAANGTGRPSVGERAPSGDRVAPRPADRAREGHPSSASRTASRVWPALAGLASAASLVFAVLWQQALDTSGRALDIDGVAVVLSDEGGEPYFLVETDYGNLRVRVTALTPPSLDDDRDFQLWQALPDRSSVRPVARLPEETGRSRTFDVDALVEGSDLFGVSIEPVDAPTDGGPTGPVVAHGDYLPTRPIR